MIEALTVIGCLLMGGGIGAYAGMIVGSKLSKPGDIGSGTVEGIYLGAAIGAVIGMVAGGVVGTVIA